MSGKGGVPRFVPMAPDEPPPGGSVTAPGGERVPFQDRLEIGRDADDRPLEAGLLLVPDPEVSRHHCVLTRRSGGRFFVRDESRNGTRIDGRRIVPHVETECRPGQTIAVSGTWRFVLSNGAAAPLGPDSLDGMNTVPRSQRCIATVLVGDITDYTVMIREALTDELQQAVRRLYEVLSVEVAAHGGTVKEFQGDAILAFWEGDASGRQAVRACRAALKLDEVARRVARDPAAWTPREHPLSMDWALSTGLVLLDSFGASGPGGLSMMGEPVVRAFRMEKFADAATGPILACRATREAAGDAFEWEDQGERIAKGFALPDRIFSLRGHGPAR
jgi:class 3 adenylate cyclase